jgi:predicted nucleotidyltransferase
MVQDQNLAVDTITPFTVKYVVEKIVTSVHPAKVIVFGSQARGDQRPGSDIDILVITNQGENREQIRIVIEKALRGRRFDLDLIVRTPEDIAWNIESENPFYTERIFKEGRVMYER